MVTDAPVKKYKPEDLSTDQAQSPYQLRHQLKSSNMSHLCLKKQPRQYWL